MHAILRWGWLVVVAAAACGNLITKTSDRRGGHQEGRVEPPDAPKPTAPPPLPLRLRLEAPATVAAGASSVPLRLVLANTGPNPLTRVMRPQGSTYDFKVTRDDGTMVWRRLEGVGVPDKAIQYRLEPGDTLAFDEMWELRDNRGGRVRAGVYRIEGRVLADPADWTAESRTLAVSR